MEIGNISFLKRWIPTGSPLWYPQFYAKRLYRSLKGRSLENRRILWHVVHQNVLIEKHKAIYLYIPKVACSTLKKLFADIIGLEIPKGALAEEIHTIDYPCVKKYQMSNKYKEYFKFAFVRNPWSRVVSCYNDKINYPSGHVYEKYNNPFIEYLKAMNSYTENMNFERFVEIICDIPDSKAEGHFRSQHCYLLDDNGRVLPDFIGRFENLSDDFDKVSSKLQLKINLPHIRKGKQNRYQEYYSNRCKDLIFKRYEKDIHMFNYHFE